MEITIYTVNTGIHSQIVVDVQEAVLDFLPVLERIVKVAKEYNDEQDKNA